MYDQVEKPKENKSRSVTISVAQKKNSTQAGFGFLENRPESIAQREGVLSRSSGVRSCFLPF